MRASAVPTILILVFCAFAAAGCGGNQIAADEVTVAPPTLTIPEDAKLTTASRSKSDDADADADATATPTATADATTGTSGTAPGTTGGTTGAAAPSTGGTTGGTTGGGTTTTQQPPADTGGASADQDFDEFCANNPGAC